MFELPKLPIKLSALETKLGHKFKRSYRDRFVFWCNNNEHNEYFPNEIDVSFDKDENVTQITYMWRDKRPPPNYRYHRASGPTIVSYTQTGKTEAFYYKNKLYDKDKFITIVIADLLGIDKASANIIKELIR
jgi:hypothetical protein